MLKPEEHQKRDKAEKQNYTCEGKRNKKEEENDHLLAKRGKDLRGKRQ